jgi:hypothetical protein
MIREYERIQHLGISLGNCCGSLYLCGVVRTSTELLRRLTVHFKALHMHLKCDQPDHKSALLFIQFITCNLFSVNFGRRGLCLTLSPVSWRVHAARRATLEAILAVTPAFLL